VRPRETLIAFDQYLADRSLRLEAIVIGGAALNLLGVVSRPTNDCHILHPALSREIARSGARLRSRGSDRLQTVFSGQALFLRCLGRDDLIRSKLFALCDRGLDLPDCVALAPTPDELAGILPWLERQDANPERPAHVRATLADVARRLGHAV
jgi:hypothetical protein